MLISYSCILFEKSWSKLINCILTWFAEFQTSFFIHSLSLFKEEAEQMAIPIQSNQISTVIHQRSTPMQRLSQTRMILIESSNFNPSQYHDISKQYIRKNRMRNLWLRTSSIITTTCLLSLQWLYYDICHWLDSYSIHSITNKQYKL